MNESENSQHVEQLKKMIAENEQMRKELKEAIETIEGRLHQRSGETQGVSENNN